MIRISIADDHPIVVDGLKNLLPYYPHIKLIAAYDKENALLHGLENLLLMFCY
jgi:DNA-binding NarL/FixJ family response regulator